MPAGIEVSDHCIVDHWEWARQGGPVTAPRLLLWWLSLDRKMHFTGLRGGVWRSPRRRPRRQRTQTCATFETSTGRWLASRRSRYYSRTPADSPR